MTFEELAKKIAEEFKNIMEQEGFSCFKEMKECYDWEASDIRSEIEYMVKEYGEAEHFAVMDDGSLIQFTDERIEPTMSYREFKKLVLNELK